MRLHHNLLFLLATSSSCCLSVSGFLGFVPATTRRKVSVGKADIFKAFRCVHNDNDGDKLLTPETSGDPSETAARHTPRTRKGFLATSLRIGLLSAGLLGPTQSDAAEEGLTMFQLPSGIKYLELEPGTGPKPRYGQLLSISYKAYIKLPANKNDPSPKPQQYDQSSAYLIKHGNGRTIEGLDEGLHTLQVGGTRRIIVPPKLGYVQSGLGPIPEYPWDRQKLNNLLDQMIALRGGTLVFEVTLLSAHDDEADQGYYEDGSLTPEQFQQLRETIQERAAQAAMESRA